MLPTIHMFCAIGICITTTYKWQKEMYEAISWCFNHLLSFIFHTWYLFTKLYVSLSEMFLSFYKEIIDAQCFLFYISLLNYTRT